MTVEEFSNSFDVLLNSYNTKASQGEQNSKAEIVLDEYEKSVLLTQAQDIVVKSYFDRTLNSQNQGFDDSARRQVDFSSLIKIANLQPISVAEDDCVYSKKWDDGNGTLGYVTVINKTNNNLEVSLKVDPEEQTDHGVNCTLTNGVLTILINPTDLDSEIDMANLADFIMDSYYSQTHAVSELISFIIDNPTAGEYPSDETAYELFDVLLGPYTEIKELPTFDDRGKIFKMPSKTITHVNGEEETVSDVLFILNEKLISAGDNYVIVPINYTEYDREMSKPYAQPLKKQAWRLFQNNVTGFDIYSELIPRFDVDINGLNYRVRYVKRPNPIVLTNLGELEIEGVTEESPCELNPILHMDILNKAVELAIATRGNTGRTER